MVSGPLFDFKFAKLYYYRITTEPLRQLKNDTFKITTYVISETDKLEEQQRGHSNLIIKYKSWFNLREL